MAIGNRKRFPILHLFNILQFHGNFSCFVLGYAPLWAVSCLITRKCLLLFFFFSIELNYCVQWLQFVWVFLFHGSRNFLVFVFLVCALGAAGSLITLKCLLLLFSFLIELDIMSSDFRPFFVCIVVQILHTVHHQVNSFRAGFLHMIFEFGFGKDFLVTF